FTHSSATESWLRLEAEAMAYGASTPLRPIADLLRSYLQLDERDDVPAIRLKVGERLAGLGNDVATREAALLTLFNLPPSDEWRQLEPREQLRRVLEAGRWLLLRASERQPLLLVLEQLDVTDAESQTFLDRLVEQLPTARILL